MIRCSIGTKALPRSKGEPPICVTCSGHLYEKKVDPFARANGSCAFYNCLALTELTWLGEPDCLWRKVDLARRETVPRRKVTRVAGPTF